MKRWLIALIPVALIVIARSGLIAESDVFWQARMGIDVLNGHAIVGSDVHSWTASGQTWTPNSWAWNIVLGFAYLHAGWAGLGAIILITGAIIFGIVIAQALRRDADIWAACLSTVLGAVIIGMWISGRPQVMTYIAFLFIVVLNTRTMYATDTKTVVRNCALIFAIQLIAINFHLGATVIIPCLIAASATSLIARRSRNFVYAVAPIITAAVASLISPAGFGVYGHALFVRAQSAGIVEWQSGVTNPAGLITIAVGICTAVIAWKSKRPEITGLVLFCTLLTATAIRFEPLVLLVAIPEVAIWFTQKAHRIHNLHYPLVAAWVVFCLCLAPIAAVAAIHPGQPASPKFSKAAVAAIPNDCRLFNQAFDGGLIELLRPEIKVSIDGRNDFFEKKEFDDQDKALREYDYGRQWLDEHSVQCVFLRTSKNPNYLVNGLVKDPAWTPIYRSDHFAVLSRAGR